MKTNEHLQLGFWGFFGVFFCHRTLQYLAYNLRYNLHTTPCVCGRAPVVSLALVSVTRLGRCGNPPESRLALLPAARLPGSLPVTVPTITAESR